MRRTSKNLLSTLGVISLVFGIAVAIPSWLNSNYFGFGVSIGLAILGAILLSIGFGD